MFTKFRSPLIFLALTLSLLSAPSEALCQNPAVPQPTPTATQEEKPKEEGHSVGHRILFYIPDRVLDVLDIFRVRARVGPGLAAGVRATKVAQVFVGTYVSGYVGLPGPRQRCLPRSPIGLESLNGVEVSVAEASVSGGLNPDYSATEFGLGAQLAIVGFDIGVDPYEILDLAVGIVGFDLRDDDC